MCGKCDAFFLLWWIESLKNSIYLKYKSFVTFFLINVSHLIMNPCWIKVSQINGSEHFDPPDLINNWSMALINTACIVTTSVDVFLVFVDGEVILESSVDPVIEGETLTLHCLHRSTNSPILSADFYKDGSLIQNQTTGEMSITTVSKSHEGFYYCKTERGQSLHSWISVRGQWWSVMILL